MNLSEFSQEFWYEKRKTTLRDLSRANIEKQLNKLISGKKVNLNITKDRETGFFVVLSDSLEGNVISGKHL